MNSNVCTVAKVSTVIVTAAPAMLTVVHLKELKRSQVEGFYA